MAFGYVLIRYLMFHINFIHAIVSSCNSLLFCVVANERKKSHVPAGKNTSNGGGGGFAPFPTHATTSAPLLQQSIKQHILQKDDWHFNNREQ